MTDCELWIEVKRFMRPSVLDRRKMLETRVKGRISCAETDKFLTSWTGSPVPVGKIFLIGDLYHD